MKKFLFILLFCFGLVNAQHVRPLLGLAYYKHSGFDVASGYYGVNAGADFRLHKNIHTEIGLNYYFGMVTSENYSYDTQGNKIAVLNIDFSNFSIEWMPRFFLGKQEDKWYYFQIVPKYSYSKIEAEEVFATISNNIVAPAQSQRNTDIQHSIGIGVGMVFRLSEKGNDIAVNLLYNNIEIGKAIEALEHNKSSISTKGVLGLQIVYYLHLKK